MEHTERLSMTNSKRLDREITHGELLAKSGAEDMWGWGTVAGLARAERRAGLISNAAGLAAGTVALEIGCGTGLFTDYFSQTGASILAIDVSDELLETARQRKLPQNQVEFSNQQFELIVGENKYDAIIGSSVLHHLELEPALENIFKLLKPGGKVVFAEPNMLNPQIFAERTLLRRRLDQVSPDETAFVRWSLSKRLQRHGFTDINITPIDWLHPLTPKALIKLVDVLGRIAEKIPILREFSGSLNIQASKP